MTQDGKLTEESLGMFSAKLEQLFLSGDIQHSNDSKKKVPNQLKQEMLSNEERIKGLDNTMRKSLGFSLKDLEPARRPTALSLTETRHFVDLTSLPEEIQASCFNRKWRSVIHDTVDDGTKLEVVCTPRPSQPTGKPAKPRHKAQASRKWAPQGSKTGQAMTGEPAEHRCDRNASQAETT